MTNELRGFLQICVGGFLVALAALGVYLGEIPTLVRVVVTWAHHPVWFVISELVFVWSAWWSVRQGIRTYRASDKKHQM
jgi:hypothetical protein